MTKTSSLKDHHALVTASKQGAARRTKALANEWAMYDINVNAVAPRHIHTSNADVLRADPTRNNAIPARIPAGRWGQPSDFDGAAVFVCPPAAHHIQGSVLDVEGAWLAR